MAVIFGVKKFHQYVYGLPFTIQNDHKPLLGILGADKGVSALAMLRLQRWALLLSAYNYKLEYKQGSRNANADKMSRLPLPTTDETVVSQVHMVDLDLAPVTAEEMRGQRDRDPVVSQIREFVQTQWPDDLQERTEFKSYRNRAEQLMVELGVLLWPG